MAPLSVRVRRLIGELSYAQRRALELQTGVCFTQPRELTRTGRRRVAELDALWDHPEAAMLP